MTADYRSWLRGIPWTYWSTFTTARPSSSNVLRRAINEYCARLSPGFGFYVVERGSEGALWHAHALLSFEGVRSIPSLEEAEKAWKLGRADVVAYDPTRGAAHYIACKVGRDHATHGVWTRTT